MSEPMDEVRANTTPGTDPRVEEMTREQAGDRTMEGQRYEDRSMEGTRTDDGMTGERTMHGHGGHEMDARGMENRGYDERGMENRGMDERGTESRGMDERGMTGDRAAYGEGEGGDGVNDPVAHYRNRFAEAQARFIDDPKSALDEARSVVEEAIDKYMDSLRMDAGAGNSGDTEQMRRAMQRYRDLFDRLAGGSRA